MFRVHELDIPLSAALKLFLSNYSRKNKTKKDCVCYIFASLFCMPEKEHL